MSKTKRNYLGSQALFLRDKLIERPYNTWELRSKFHIYSPVARIAELKKSGCAFDKSWKTVKDITGGLHRVRQYTLVPQFNQEVGNDG